MSRSAYVARVGNQGLRCFADAVWNTALQVLLSLTEALQKDGSEVTYPKQELPDAVKWGKDKWSPDYRDKTESTVMIQALHHAKLPALLTLLFRDILKWLHRADILTLLLLSKRKSISCCLREEYVTDDARMPAQEELLTRQLQLTKLKDS